MIDDRHFNRPLEHADFRRHTAKKKRGWACKITGSVVFLAAVVALGGCAGPNTKSIAYFGQTASKAVAVMNDAGAVQSELRLETALHHEACQYLRRSPRFRLGGPPVGAKFKLISERAVFTRSLANYMAALVAADDPKSVAQLKLAASALAKSLGKTISIASVGSPAALAAGPVLNFFINGLVELDELKRRREILDVATKADDVLFSIQQRIGKDQKHISASLVEKLDLWDTKARCVLRSMQSRDPENFSLFLEIDEKKRNYKARIELIDKTPQIYRRVVDAHHAMISSEASFEESIAVLESVLAEVQALADALSKI